MIVQYSTTPTISFNWFGSGRELVICSTLCEGILQDKLRKVCVQVPGSAGRTVTCRMP